jgi:hypothetical protein
MPLSSREHFKMKLALALGKTLLELEQSMSWLELMKWTEYDKEYGIPDPWLQTGMECQVTAQGLGDGTKQYYPEDFMPVEKKAKQQSVAQMKSTMKAIKLFHNAK